MVMVVRCSEAEPRRYADQSNVSASGQMMYKQTLKIDEHKLHNILFLPR